VESRKFICLLLIPSRTGTSCGMVDQQRVLSLKHKSQGHFFDFSVSVRIVTRQKLKLRFI
jgi:hypothetical protein